MDDTPYMGSFVRTHVQISAALYGVKSNLFHDMCLFMFGFECAGVYVCVYTSRRWRRYCFFVVLKAFKWNAQAGKVFHKNNVNEPLLQ